MISERTRISMGLGLLMLAAAGTASFAAEILKTDDLAVSIGGNIQLMVIGQNEFDVADNGSRLH